jgi:hypothetical protein
VKKGSAIVGLAVAVLLAVGALGAGASGSAPVKKRCHIVKKKVHGKVKRVRVCTKPKPKPKPKNISVSLEQSGQTKVSIGEEGGSVSAGATSGAKVSLAIPAGALAEETQITLTPVSAVRGLTKIRLVAGAQFAPEGLALAKPATLTLETPKAGGARALGWFGAGKDVFRYPSKRSGTKIQVRVTHFSGVGIAQGPASAWNGVPAATTALRAFYRSDVKPLMNRALRFDQLTGLALDAAFGWERQVRLLGLEREFKAELAEIRELLPKLLQNAADKALERCTAGHDLSQARRMLSIARLAELMGIKLQGETLFDRLEKCMRFELDFETTLTGTDEPAHLASWTIVVRAAVPVRLKPDFSGGGEAQLDYATWNYSFVHVFPGVCTLTGTSSGVRLGSPFQVLGLTVDFGEEPTGPPVISMRIFPGKPHESATFSGCPNIPPGEDNYMIYFTSFGGLYAGQLDPSGGFRVDGWSYLGGEAWARRVYQRTTAFTASVIEGNPNPASLTVSENTTYLLRHTPAG